jgi:hypothetical protein
VKPTFTVFGLALLQGVPAPVQAAAGMVMTFVDAVVLTV